MQASEVVGWLMKLREPKFRIAGLVLGAIAIILFAVLFSTANANAADTHPTVTTVYSEEDATPTAYVITTGNGVLFFCAITAGQTVYTCQQLPEGAQP